MITNRSPLINQRLYPAVLIFALIILCSITSVAQTPNVQIVDSQSAQAQAQKLAGVGVVVSNVVLDCEETASGIFVTQGTNLGLDSGVILTTGSAVTRGYPRPWGIEVYNGANGHSKVTAHTRHLRPGDVDLTNYAKVPTFDACALEFDFKAQGDSILFEYVFASEEYTLYSCTGFNDVFAFFISGPGITGLQNIAVIPGTNIPVSVNSTTDTAITNPPKTLACTNMGAGSPFSQYYVDNFGMKGTAITYDGFTKIFTARAGVQPCSTYHLRLVIADGNDYKLDSGVWLKANSLSANIPKVTPVSSYSITNNVPVAVRGCKNAKFQFSRPSARPDSLVVKYTIGGTAINGVDYDQIADSVVIPAGATTADVYIDAKVVSPATGMKTAKVYLYAPYDCGPRLPVDSATIEIWDELKLILNNNDTAICDGERVSVTGVGEVDYTFSWSPTVGVNNPSDINTVITPDTTTIYTVTASFPGCNDATKSLKIEVQPYPVVEAGANIEICKGATETLTANASPSWYNNYTYYWYPSDDLDKGSGKSVTIMGDGDTKIFVRAVTSVGCYGVDSLNVDVLPEDFAHIVSDSLGLCPNDTLEIEVDGGVAYGWEPDQYINTTSSAKVKVYPVTDMLYDVKVVSDKGCIDTIRVPVEVYPGAVLYLGPDVTLYPGEHHQMNPGGNCEYIDWFPEVGLSNPHSNNPIAKPDVYTRYFAYGTTKYGCKTTDTIDIYQERTILDVPNAFNPTGYENKELKIIKRGIATLKYFRIFNRWGEVVFETTDIEKGWDGKFNGVDQPVGVFVYMIEAVTDDGRPFVRQGNITLLR